MACLSSIDPSIHSLQVLSGNLISCPDYTDGVVHLLLVGRMCDRGLVKQTQNLDTVWRGRWEVPSPIYWLFESDQIIQPQVQWKVMYGSVNKDFDTRQSRLGNGISLCQCFKGVNYEHFYVCQGCFKQIPFEVVRSRASVPYHHTMSSSTHDQGLYIIYCL